MMRSLLVLSGGLLKEEEKEKGFLRRAARVLSGMVLS